MRPVSKVLQLSEDFRASPAEDARAQEESDLRLVQKAAR